MARLSNGRVVKFFRRHAPSDFVCGANERQKTSFKRLAKRLGWKGETLGDRRQEFNDALLGDVETIIADGSLEMFQGIVLAIEPDTDPSDISSKTKCKKIIKTFFVNIYDFADGDYVDHGSLSALRKYSVANKLVMPSLEAKASLAFKQLLRPIFGGGKY